VRDVAKTVLTPADEAETAAVVADAVTRGMTLELRGTGSRAGLGDPVTADAVLDLSRMTGIVAYEPEELILTARAATPLAEIESLLAGRSQQLAFEPPDFGPLHGRTEGLGTLGGAMAIGIGGPRRTRAGAPRDHLLGFRGINGLGEAFVGGGRVVKNVTGFDLPKLMAGSFGALGVMTELTVKVLPRAEMRRTLAISGLDTAEGLALLRRAMALPGPVSAGALVPAELVPGLVEGVTETLVLIRLEGVDPAVQAATDLLARDRRATCRVLEDDARQWRAIGGGWPLAAMPGPVCRIGAPPSFAGQIARALQQAGAAAVLHDNFGSVLLAAAPDTVDGIVQLRAALRGVCADSHLTVIRPGRFTAAAFDPTAPGIVALTRRIKSALDPHGVFNPGRLPGGA